MRFSTENVMCAGCSLLIGKGEAVQYARRGPNAGKRFHPHCYPNKTEDTGYVPEDTESEDDKPFIPAPSTPKVTSVPQTSQVQSQSEVKPVTGNPLSDAIVDAIWPSIATLVEGAKSSASNDSTAAIELANQFTSEQIDHVKEWTANSISALDANLTRAIFDQISEAIKGVKVESQKIEFSIPGLPPVIVSTPHPQLPKLLKAMQLGHVPYLFGQAGSGKTHAALDVAEVLGYSKDETYVVTCNPFSSPIELIGYTAADGKQVDKAFIRCFRDGGFIILDEADRSRPDFLPALNSALANGQLVSPDGTIVRQHERFALVCTGNTPMHGQSKAYNSASRQDASVIDRLFYIEWFIDEKLETKLALAIDENAAELVSTIQAIRAFVKPTGGNQAEVNVTMRGTLSAVKTMKHGEGIFSRDEVLDATIFKAIASDTKDRILKGI